MKRSIAICCCCGLLSCLLILCLSNSFVVRPVHANPPLMQPSMQPSQSAQVSPEVAIERLFTQPQLQSAWFSQDFLQQLPLPQIQAIIDELRSSLGNFQSVQPDGDNYLTIFEKGKLATQIVLNNNGQILSLFFQPRSNAISPQDALFQLRQFPGKVNLLVLENTTELAALNPEQPLAVGSAFKLAVLAALNQQIRSGQRNWRDVVELRSTDKSLPSGFLQSWFDGSQLTVQTLATLMISISDNTATDTLIHLIGRAPIEALTPRNRPLLTTREFFTLKDPQNAELLQRYRAGNAAQRRQVLTDLAQRPLPNVSIFSNGQPIAIDTVEWFFTPRELCTLMAQVGDRPEMSVNSGGVADPSDWEKVAFKGGSEPGVLNLTTQLKSRTGKTYCVTATWNNTNATVEEARLLTIYTGIIEFLKNHSN